VEKRLRTQGIRDENVHRQWAAVEHQRKRLGTLRVRPLFEARGGSSWSSRAAAGVPRSTVEVGGSVPVGVGIETGFNGCNAGGASLTRFI